MRAPNDPALGERGKQYSSCQSCRRFGRIGIRRDLAGYPGSGANGREARRRIQPLRRPPHTNTLGSTAHVRCNRRTDLTSNWSGS